MRLFSLLLLLFFVGSSHALKAQQDAQYTQFMFNKLYFNPAYAASKGGLCISGIYRNQWLGIKGAPQTQTLNVQGLVANRRVGLGLTVTADQIGLLNSWNVETSYAYRIPVGEESFLNLGLRGSVSFMNFRWDKAELTQGLDANVAINNNNLVLPNFGFGAYYGARNFYVGVSVPHLFQNQIDFLQDSTAFSSVEPRLERHYFMMGGVLINLSENIQFKPAILLKYVPRSPFDMDINISFVFYNRLLAGVSYRLGDSIDAVVQIAITPQLKLGLGYDFTITKLQRYNAGSLEVVLEACFFNKDNLKANHPRFF